MPKVSIVIITYDRPTYIKAMLEALKLQTFKDFEAIIVDDGSLYSPYEAVKRFENELDTKYIRLRDKPWNYCEARNLGIKISYGEVILFFDDDVIPCQRCIENHYKRHSTENRTMVFGQLMGNPDLKPEQAKDYLVNKFPKGATSGFRPLVKNFSVKRKEVFAVNGLDLDYSGHYGYEDSDFIERLSKNGVEKVQAPECEALALIAHSGHSKYSKDTKRNLELRRRKVKEGRITCKRGLWIK